MRIAEPKSYSSCREKRLGGKKRTGLEASKATQQVRRHQERNFKLLIWSRVADIQVQMVCEEALVKAHW